MMYRNSPRLILLVLFIFILSFIGCTSKEEKMGPVTTEQSASDMEQATPPMEVPAAPSSVSSASAVAVIIDVDGSKLTRKQLDSEMRIKMEAIKKNIPAGRTQQIKAEMRKQIINDFTVRTLLANEVNRMKISTSDQDVSEAIERLKSSLPQGMTIEDFMKKNKFTKEKMYEEIRLGIKINKLVLLQATGKTKPTEKEITKFYQKNKEKFSIPESAHVRHILVAKAPGDDEKIKTEKKSKAEELRKRLIAGASFAEIAKNNSDCPSKNNGGDLGVFSRGEMVKPFEYAAFSQEINSIGPVVETEFGYHIIQVLEHFPPKTLTLDDNDTKARISAFLQQQKQQEAFETLIKKLRSKAHIVVYKD